MPAFAFEYLDGGCFYEVNLARNTAELREVQLRPYYLRDYGGCSLQVELFGTTYDAPFGVAPIGLQGLMTLRLPVGGVALVLEWLRAAETSGCQLSILNLPEHMRPIIDISDLDPLFAPLIA